MPNCMPDTRQFDYAHENTVLLGQSHTHTHMHRCAHTHTAAVGQFHFIWLLLCVSLAFEYHIRFFFSRPNAFKISSEIFLLPLLNLSFSYKHTYIQTCAYACLYVCMYVCIFVLCCHTTVPRFPGEKKIK